MALGGPEAPGPGACGRALGGPLCPTRPFLRGVDYNGFFCPPHPEIAARTGGSELVRDPIPSQKQPFSRAPGPRDGIENPVFANNRRMCREV
jgi:hypothetical protein